MMLDSVSSEFSSFLRMLSGENSYRYIDDAKRLMKAVKEASEAEISRQQRQSRMDALTNLLRDLVRKLDDDLSMDYRFRIPIAAREMCLFTLDPTLRLARLGEFELAVRRFEHPEKPRPRWSDTPPTP